MKRSQDQTVRMCPRVWHETSYRVPLVGESPWAQCFRHQMPGIRSAVESACLSGEFDSFGRRLVPTVLGDECRHECFVFRKTLHERPHGFFFFLVVVFVVVFLFFRQAQHCGAFIKKNTQTLSIPIAYKYTVPHSFIHFCLVLSYFRFK